MICRFCRSEPIEEYLCNFRARNGHIFCLEYVHKILKLEWTEETCYYAACNGHLDCLIYLHENGCPWDYITCEGATEHGHLDCLEYAHKNGCPLSFITSNRLFDKRFNCLKIQHKDELFCGKDHKIFQCFRYEIDNGCAVDQEFYETIQDVNSYIERSRKSVENIYGKDIGNIVIDFLRLSR